MNEAVPRTQRRSGVAVRPEHERIRRAPHVSPTITSDVIALQHEAIHAEATINWENF